MGIFRRIFGALIILALISVAIWLPTGPLQPADQADLRSAAGGAARDALLQQEPAGDLLVSDPVTPFLTAALGDLPVAELEYWLDREINPRLHFGAGLDETYNPELGPDPLLAVQEAAEPAAPDAFGTPLLNFNGQGYSFVNPPDTIGDVGPNHYVQMINATRVTIYNKDSGSVIGGPFQLGNLAPAGDPCRTSAGDPIVLHDQLANRWLLSEFASSGNNLCVYISQTADPGGTYYFYRFQTPNFPDYPKYAVWPDGYYVSTNENGGPAVYALDRTRMLAGLSATFQRRSAPALAGFGFQALTPADLDGSTAPPSGTPGLFMRHRDTEVHGPAGMPSNDLLEVWAFTVNWTTPASSTFTKIQDIQVAEFDSALCGLTSFSCISQPGTSTQLDPLREVIMWRLSYRNFGTRQVLVGNFATDVGSDRAGVRWFELRKTGANWGLFQEGTYAPGNISRWMGAIAMDQSGNIALGYNVGSSGTYPGLRYVGRLASDAAGTMPQGEYTIVNGTAANGSNRYGDYSAMSIDPADDCTFWFTGQWNDASQWKTRIAKLKFDQCGATPPPGAAKAYLPLVLRSIPPTTPAWVNITTEDFEGAFPKSGWQVVDNEPGYGVYYWGKRTCRPSSGSYSGWAVGAGANGASLSCGANYPNNAESWLIYGPFSTAGTANAELLFDYWLRSEINYDSLVIAASIDNKDYYGSGVSGNSGGWQSRSFDLADWPGFGNLLGRSSVWIGFIFISDGSITFPEGAYVDNIVLRKMAGPAADRPVQEASCAPVQQGDLVIDPCKSLTAGVRVQSDK